MLRKQASIKQPMVIDDAQVLIVIMLVTFCEGNYL